MDDNLINLSLIVGLRNNLAYSKTFYESVRRIYPTVEIVFVSYGSTDGTHEWLDSLNDNFVRYYHAAVSKTLSDTYNKGVSLATSKLIAYLHNDMIVSAGFVEELCANWEPNSVLFYTVVEPPIFADDKHRWKLVEDFGTDLETFKADEFDAYCIKRQQVELTPFRTNDICFFLCMEKAHISEMGGMDPLYAPMFCEDSDILLRFKLQQLNLIQVPKSLAYHFVSKTSRFSADYADKTKKIEENSTRNFYRKWGFGPGSNVIKRYDIVATIRNPDVSRFRAVEPYFRKVYVDADVSSYIDLEQPNTIFDLTDRIRPLSDQGTHDILVTLDFNKLREKDVNRLPYLTELIEKKIFKKRSVLGRLFFNKRKFHIGNIIFKVQALNSSEKELITRPIDYI